TVARIEQGKLQMKNDQFILILKRTKRDLLSTLLEDCGKLYRELASLAQEISLSSGTDSSAQGIWPDRELETGMADLFSAARTIFLKITRTSDEKRWASDLLLRAAGEAPSTPKRRRAGKRGKPPSETQE